MSDEPQGSSPTASAPCASSSGWRNTPEGSEGGVSPLNLDRLAQKVAEWRAAQEGNDREDALIVMKVGEVEGLLARVRALEAALKEIAWMEERWEVAESADELDFTAWFWEAVAGARSALAVVDGGGNDGQ